MSAVLAPPRGPIEVLDESTGTVLVFETWLESEAHGLERTPPSRTRALAAGEAYFEVTLADLLG